MRRCHAARHSMSGRLDNRTPCDSIPIDGPNVRKADSKVRSGRYSIGYSLSVLDTLKWHKRIHFAHYFTIIPGFGC